LQISSEAVVREYIKRVKEVEPFLNAVVEHRFDEAIKDAQRADKIIESTSEIYVIQNYPLLGVPFTVKESISLRNLSHGTATKPREGAKADKDAVVVERLKAAGAIPLLVSTTPEYCVSWETYNHVSGRTLNPHNLKRTPGGSSGGEAALIGSGASCFGIGELSRKRLGH
jgi:Asp-tRNA(Asn)/Glu-tRNA(Gln) amidotransferase A subunit family amidase